MPDYRIEKVKCKFLNEHFIEQHNVNYFPSLEIFLKFEFSNSNELI